MAEDAIEFAEASAAKPRIAGSAGRENAGREKKTREQPCD